MKDARIVVDELVIECLGPSSEAEARRIGGGAAQELVQQLKDLQVQRLQEIRRGTASPRRIHIARMVVHLASTDISPATIGRALRGALDDAWRHDERSV